jgi:hypothetical protein
MGIGYVEGWSYVWEKELVELWIGQKTIEGNGSSWEWSDPYKMP